MSFPNPLIPGFNPDPSIVKVGENYYLATSTFEYLPGLPIYHSTDLISWTQIGNVVEREGQLDSWDVPTLGGAWAPTIRHHEGLFYLAVTDAVGRGTLVFTATDAAGPWSDGTPIHGAVGIDPDLAWDSEGNAYMTYSGLDTITGQASEHGGILQVRVDLENGKALEQPRSVWSGTGLMFPEAPHLYQHGNYWYLLIAEGGTERGHSVSIARGTSPQGPFENNLANPVLSARSTDRPIQNTGHGDLVQTPDGAWAMVMLGTRPRGMNRAFSALGRETFITQVHWEEGWPVVEPVTL
ncbi:family 43 glycosylhydrolase [Arthrobacter sp. SA17]